MTDTRTIINVRLSPDELQKLDDVRREERDLPSRAVTLRRLIHRAAGTPVSASIEKTVPASDPARRDRWATA
jgi:hypothetical protein